MKTRQLLLLLTILLSIRGISQNKFTFELYEQLDSDKNILFSSTSIKSAFAMAFEGANGNTQSEFEKVFDFKEDNSAFIKEIEGLKQNAKISNSIWMLEKYQVLQSYIKTVKSKFDSEPYRTDFINDPSGSADKINEWIEKSTNGMITKMLTATDVPDFKMAIVNAVYFKKNWKKPFVKDQTRKKEFTNLDGSKIEVDMMFKSDYFRAGEGSKEKIIELPYEGDETSMIVILPNKMKGYKMTEKLYSELNPKLYHRQVHLNLPKFTFGTPTFELKGFLKKMGLIEAFSDGADFSGMRKEKDLKIGTVLHKAKIIVNEEGTEAAAATVIGMVQTTSASTPPPIFEFNADKPFFYFIKDNKTGAIMFMGRMNEMEKV